MGNMTLGSPCSLFVIRVQSFLVPEDGPTHTLNILQSLEHASLARNLLILKPPKPPQTPSRDPKNQALNPMPSLGPTPAPNPYFCNGAYWPGCVPKEVVHVLTKPP